MPYDLEGARKSGVSDAEIADALSSKLDYDLDGARKSGVADKEIADALANHFNTLERLNAPRPQGFKPGKEMARRAEEASRGAVDRLLLRDPGVDYTTGVKDFSLRAGFSRMDTDRERENYLAQSVGEGNFGRDKYGRYYIRPAGLERRGISSERPIALEDPGLSRYDIADVAGSAPSMIGAAGMGIAASGMGAIPGMLLSGLGAAGGKAIDEIIKSAQGLNLKSAPEETMALLSEAGLGLAGEGVGRALVGAGTIARAPYARFSDPERQELTREALAAGLTPKVFQFQPRGKLLARFQSMGENVLGDAAEANNKAALEAALERLKGSAGRRVPDAGERLISDVETYAKNLSEQTNIATRKAQLGLDSSLQTIRRNLGLNDPNVGARVQSQIKEARAKFGENASALYGEVDALVGGRPIVPTRAVKEKLDEFLADLPTDKSGGKIFPTPELERFFAKYGNIADLQTARQMQQLRTDFRNASESRDLVQGIEKRRARLLMSSVDQAFEDAATSSVPGVDGAIEKLRLADAFYKKGIQKFDAPLISAITREASQTGAVEADRVVDSIIRPGYTASARRVKELVSRDVWANVQRSHFEDLLARSTRLIDGNESVSGATLYGHINKMGRTFDVVYGESAPEIRAYVKELAARDGKIDPSVLSAGNASNVVRNLETAISKQRELDNFLSENYLAQLAKPGQEATQAAEFIFRPNSPRRIAEAKKFYGESSETFQGLQNEAMKKLLADFVQPGKDPLKTIFDGKALNATLNKYGREMLVETFGRDTTDELFKFGRIAQFVTQANPNSGGIVAAAVALHPLRNIWKIVDLAGTGYLLRQPGAIKWLSEGIQSGNKAKAAAAITRLSALATALVKDKTSAGAIDLSAPDVSEQP